ncbi:MAG TPA: TMEM175 family protein [Caulobacteraceae bacterium]|jgi:uncharacterized membrane protein|nr:TMEM175 family protein [Caulobacteraceae bacterium]
MTGQLDSLDPDAELEHRRHRHWYDRLMMLCDGVFAISITLLAAEIRVPAGWGGDWAGLWSSLAGQLDAYAMSFLVISVYWLAHRRFMALITKVDAPVTVLTLVMLGLVALLPATTRMISAYGLSAVARLTYAGLVIAIGLTMATLWAYAALIAQHIPAQVNIRLRWFFLLLMALTPPFFLALVLALPANTPGLNPVILAALFLIGWRLRAWMVRRMGGKPHIA